MQKVVLLFSVFLCSMVLNATQIDKKYLEGGIPEVSGNIVFQKKISFESNEKQKDIYEALYTWLTAKCEISDKYLANSILYFNPETFELTACLQTKLVFHNEGIILDDAIMQYIMKIKIYNDYLEIIIQNIKFDYFDQKFKDNLRIKGDWIPAERIISDAVSMNKQKNKLFKPYDKFRTFTIDQIDNIYAQILVYIRNEKKSVSTSNPKGDDIKMLSTPIIVKDESVNVENKSSISVESNSVKAIFEKGNVLIIAGDQDGFCISTPISYSIQKVSGKVLQLYLELDETSCVSKMIETGSYTIVKYEDAYEPLLTSMSDQKKFTIDTFQKLGLFPIELSSKNIGIENAKFSMTVEPDPRETNIIRRNKIIPSSSSIFIGKIYLSDTLTK